MAENLGKKFENRLLHDWRRCFPGTLIYRLPDQQSGYAGGGSSNPCDFLGFTGSDLLMIECKAHAGQSISFSAIRQYSKMLEYKGLRNVYPGVIIWFYEKDTIIWVPIEEMEKMVTNGEKSVGLRMIDEKKPYKVSYNIIEIPAKKLRTFMEADLNYLVNQFHQYEYVSHYHECTWPQGLPPTAEQRASHLQALLEKHPELADIIKENKENLDG